MTDDLASFLPLSPATLHILLSLAGEDLHGYAIMQEVARQSEGKYKVGPGNPLRQSAETDCSKVGGGTWRRVQETTTLAGAITA